MKYLILIITIVITGCGTVAPCSRYETITETEYVRINERVEVPVTKVRKICVRD